MLMNKEYIDEKKKEWYEKFDGYLFYELGIEDEDTRVEIFDNFINSQDILVDIPSDQEILDFVEDYKLRQEEDE